jgi:hypothetical protein
MLSCPNNKWVKNLALSIFGRKLSICPITISMRLPNGILIPKPLRYT